MSWLEDLQKNDTFSAVKGVLDGISMASSDPSKSKQQQAAVLNNAPVEQQINAQNIDPKSLAFNVGGVSVNPWYVAGGAAAALALFLALR